jgi:hypothetical protein
MSDLSVGLRKSFRCGDGTIRTGRITYIHPYGQFVVAEFEGKGGNWKEAFQIVNLARECKTVNNADGNFQPTIDNTFDGRRGKKKKKFTPEEDAAILKTTNTEKTARELHRSGAAIRNRRILLRRRKRG